MQRHMRFIFLKDESKKGMAGNEIAFNIVCPHPLSSEEAKAEFQRLSVENGVDWKEYSVKRMRSLGDPF